MNLRTFSEANRRRCESPQGFDHDLDSWSPAEWTNAVAGEVGEACNLSKKILRHMQGIRGNVKEEDKHVPGLKIRLAAELCDAVIYIDLAIQALGLDMAEVLPAVFNGKSKQIGYPEQDFKEFKE